MPTKLPAYSFRNEAATGTPIVQLYGYIGQYEDINPVKFMADFDTATAGHTDVVFEINCGGGSVIDGFAIIDLLSTRKKNITCRVFGMAASMGFVLMLVGKRIEMAVNATLMTHRVSVSARGDADAIARMAELCRQYEAKIIAMTVARTGLPEATVQAWFATGIDKWFTAGEALQNKIIDGIIESPVPTARIAPPQNATPTEVYHFYNSILNRQNTDLMTPEQLAAIGLQADATPAQITARIARLNACEVENTTLKAEAKKAKAAAVADIVAKAEAKGLAKHVVAALENTANQDLETAEIMLDAMDNASTDPAEPTPPKRASLRELIDNADRGDAAGQPENRKHWGYMDWAQKDSAGLQAMSPEKREKLANEM